MPHQDPPSLHSECCPPLSQPQSISVLCVGKVAGESPLLEAMSLLGHLVNYVDTGNEALAVLKRNHTAEAILISHGIHCDPYVVAPTLRRATSLPIILLFSYPTLLNPTRAFEAGADEWLLTNVHPRELVARIQARIRRHQLHQRQNDYIEHYGALSLNPRTHELVIDNRTISLTPTETHILRYLAASPNHPVSVVELAHQLDALTLVHVTTIHLLSIVHELRTKLHDTPALLLCIDDKTLLLSD